MPFSTHTTGHYSWHTALSTTSTAHPAIRLPPSERAAMVTRMRALSSGLQRLLDAFLGTHTCTYRSYEHVFICICMILYACINNILILCFYKCKLMDWLKHFETLQDWLKHLGEIWSAVFLVDGGGVANDINDAAELHHAAEQAGVWNRVLWFCMLITASPNHMSSYMFGVIRILLTMISLKSTYQVIHEAFSTGRNHQVLRGCVVHLKWSMVWRWRAQGGTSGCIAGDVVGCGQVLQRAKKNVEAGEDQEFRANGKV